MASWCYNLCINKFINSLPVLLCILPSGALLAEGHICMGAITRITGYFVDHYGFVTLIVLKETL